MIDAETELPSWCVPPNGAAPRDALVADALAAIRDAGVVWLRGAPGAGTSTALGLVGRALVAGGTFARVVGLRAHPELRVPDALRALAVEVGAFPADRVGAHFLATRTVVVVDDADLAASTVEELRAALPAAAWVLGGRPPGTGLDVPPLGVAAAPADEPPGMELYGGVPMGVAGAPVAAWAPWLVPLPGRLVLRRSVAERLGGGLRAEALGATLRDDLERVHQIVCGVALDHHPDDLVWLRACAERVNDPDLAALAAAATARMLLTWNALDEAAAAITQGRMRFGVGGTAAALLSWLEGDLWTARGALDEADRSHQRALEWFVGAGLLEAAGALAGHAAEDRVRRGFIGRARRWTALARESSSITGQVGAWSDTLRVAAEAAAASGEIVGAATLLDEAEAMARRRPAGAPAAVSIALSRAGLELARGATAAAEELLAAVATDARTGPAASASIAWRRAELDLRRNRRDQAAAEILAARAGYAKAASLRGLRLVERLEGDRRALGGDLDGAVTSWLAGLRLAIADRDLDGARRLLRRLLAVERHTGAQARVDELRDRLSAVEAALRMR